MSRKPPIPATTGRLVAGLDVLTHSERDGDELAHRISAALADHRGGSGIRVATQGRRSDSFAMSR